MWDDYMGRRGKYETHIKPHLDEIKDLVRIMNEADIADKFGIAISSWENYKRDHSEFREALLGGREILIEELRDTMKMKARGYPVADIADITGLAPEDIEKL